MNFNPVLHRLRAKGVAASVTATADENAEALENVRKARGVTLVEVMMVLGVMAFLLGLVMLVAALVNGTNKSNQFIEEVTTIVDVSNQLTQGQSDLTDLTDQTIAASGLMPKRWTTGSTGGNAASGLVSPFGSTVSVKGVAAGAGTNGLTTYTISASQVPSSACVKVSVVDFGNSLVARTPAGDSNGAPLTATQATSGCGSSPTTMTFEFSRD